MKKRKAVRIIFRNTVNMTAAATLLFKAELERLRHFLPDCKVSCDYPVDGVVAQVLMHVGLFETMNQRRTCVVDAANVTYWQVFSGSGSGGQEVGVALKVYEDVFNEARKPLYRALTEAATNSHQHAYESARGDGLGNLPKWWVFSRIQAEDLFVAACDLGIGIPGSLRLADANWKLLLLHAVVSLRLPYNDANLIYASLWSGQTRTRKDHRGKGLPDIRAVIDAFQGKLQIFSNRGLYTYDGMSKKETVEMFPSSILGTIVTWSIPLQHLL